MSHTTKTIRVNLELYNKLTELGKKNETYDSILERILNDNDLIAMVTEK